MNDPKKGTGRTQRMLVEAATAAAHGFRVAVIASDERQRRDLSMRLAQMMGQNTKVPVETVLLSELDWRTMTVSGKGTGSPDIVLVDHFAIEQHWGAMIAMLHRFDAPTGVPA